MMLVKAEWRVGYPEGDGRKIYSPGEKFRCSKNWGLKKSKQDKVTIIKKEVISEEMPVKKLKKKAKELSIKGYTKMKKDQLLKKLKEELDE